jgi:hypothetical protein
LNDHELMQTLRDTRRVDDAGIAAVTDRHALVALREGITMTDRNSTPTTEVPRRARRLGRRGLVSGALALALVGGGAAYAVSQLSDGPTLDLLNCAEALTLGADGEVHLGGAVDGIPASGDDLADCSQIRADAGLPALADPYAFVYRGTHFVVSRAGVPSEVVQDAQAPLPAVEVAAQHELEAAMDDWVDGPNASCFTTAQAKDYASKTLARVGLTGWTTRILRDEQNPTPGPCATLVAFADQHVVEVRELSRPPIKEDPANIAPEVFTAAQGLRTQVATPCLSLPEAKRIARSLVRPIDDVAAVVDEKAACTRVDMVVGGVIFVTLHGPSVARP